MNALVLNLPSSIDPAAAAEVLHEAIHQHVQRLRVIDNREGLDPVREIELKRASATATALDYHLQGLLTARN